MFRRLLLIVPLLLGLVIGSIALARTRHGLDRRDLSAHDLHPTERHDALHLPQGHPDSARAPATTSARELAHLLATARCHFPAACP